MKNVGFFFFSFSPHFFKFFFSSSPTLYIHDGLHPTAGVSPACDYERFLSGIVMSVSHLRQTGMRSSVFVRSGRGVDGVVRRGRSRMRRFSGLDI